MSVELIKLGQIGHFPTVGRTRERVSALRFEMLPTEQSDLVHIEFTLAAMPVDFVRSDGRQTGYSVGCLEANFRLDVEPGKLDLDPVPEVRFQFTGTTQTEKEKSADFRPKIGVKGGTEGVGADIEVAGAARKGTTRKTKTATGPSDDPRLKCLVLKDGGWVHWIMSPAPVHPDPPALRHGMTIAGDCRWPDRRCGEIRMYGRPYVFVIGVQPIPGPIQLLAKFFHRLMGLRLYKDMRAERFEIVEA